MTATREHAAPRLKYHHNAYQFVFQALQYTQERLDRKRPASPDEEEEAHITGQELLAGIRDLAREQFGLLTCTVFNRWGIRATDDFGRIVFELVERGEMRKTDHDRLSDFYDVFEFGEAFDTKYAIDTSKAFRSC